MALDAEDVLKVVDELQKDVKIIIKDTSEIKTDIAIMKTHLGNEIDRRKDLEEDVINLSKNDQNHEIRLAIVEKNMSNIDLPEQKNSIYTKIINLIKTNGILILSFLLAIIIILLLLGPTDVSNWIGALF